MSNHSPIPSPPPELVGEWLCSEDYPWGPLEQASVTITTNRLQNVATQAARWGADQELEACVEWLANRYGEESHVMDLLRAARRPKPRLKEQALKSLEGMTLPDDAFDTIRRAIEQLPD